MFHIIILNLSILSVKKIKTKTMKKSYLNLSLFFLVIFASCLKGQTIDKSAIDKIFTKWDNTTSPGCGLGIIENGVLTYARGYGMANLEYDIPNSATSVFRIGSTSKQFTAACIVLLNEQGKLSLDHTLDIYFPDFPDYAKKITIQHLLNHTSGIRDYLQLSYLKGLGDDDFYTDDHIMEWLISQTDLNFVPGDEYLYSNSGYWLLGQIVEKTSGMNMADYAMKEIFVPLEMNNTHFHNDHTQIVKNRASGYTPNSKDGYNISMTTLDMIGDGGIFTSINDIKKWDDAFYESKTLSKAFWKIMTKQAILNDGKEISYAAGLGIDTYKGLKTVSHGGAFVGFRAELMRFPDQKTSIAIFANRADANPTRMAYQVADILLKDQFKEENTEVKKEIIIEEPKVETQFSMDQIAGEYELEPGVVLNISLKNDSLKVLQTWNQSTYNIVKTSGNTYKIPGDDSALSFTFSDLEKDKIQTLTVLQNGNKTVTKRKKIFDSSGIDFQVYTGTYYSEELDINYKILLEEKTIKLQVGNNPAMKCTITELDQFSSPFGMIRFQKDNGNISGFELDSGRVKNLKFKKT